MIIVIALQIVNLVASAVAIYLLAGKPKNIENAINNALSDIKNVKIK